MQENKYYSKLKSLFTGNDRSNRYKKNTLLLFFFQIGNIAISLLLVPITFQYLGIEEYGIWLTLTTLVSWFVLFDIGLGHGLRNKYAEAKAKNDLSEIRYYISSTFFFLVLISLCIFFILLLSCIFIDWTVVLNAPKYLASDLRLLTIVISAMFCLRFVISIVTTLLTAEQEPSIPALINFSGNLLSLFTVYLVTKIINPSLLYTGIALTVSQLFPLLVAFIYLFLTRYKPILPSLRFFSKTHIRSILSLGVRFFLIQITALVLFQSNNLIIAHTCGLKEVSVFNIAFKYFNILYIAFTTFLTPLWSASTDAYTKGDFVWIKSAIKKLNLLWLLVVLGGVLMILISPITYKIWLKNSLHPDFILLTLLWLYFVFLTRSAMYRSFMNGTGKITLQFYVTFIQSLLHIPLAILLGKSFGLSGVVAVMILWVFINSIWEQMQFKYIVSNSAKGIWNR